MAMSFRLLSGAAAIAESLMAATACRSFSLTAPCGCDGVGTPYAVVAAAADAARVAPTGDATPNQRQAVREVPRRAQRLPAC